MLVHASCISIDDQGVLIRGPSGCGKSDLALRLIDGGGRLIADDQVELEVENGHLVARCPAPILGLMEVRHVGVLAAPHARHARLSLILDPATAGVPLPRLPESATTPLLGIDIPTLCLAYFEASAAAKIRLILQQTKLNRKSIE